MLCQMGTAMAAAVRIAQKGGNTEVHDLDLCHHAFKMILIVLAAAAPLAGFESYSKQRLCDGTGFATTVTEKMCANPMFSPYGHIQSTWWGVGLFNYWKVKQIPNFLLMVPILLIATSALWRYYAYGASLWELVAIGPSDGFDGGTAALVAAQKRQKAGVRIHRNNYYECLRSLFWPLWRMAEVSKQVKGRLASTAEGGAVDAAVPSLTKEVLNEGTAASGATPAPMRADPDMNEMVNLARPGSQLHSWNPLLQPQLLPHMMHMFLLILTVMLVAHVQILTRLLCAACPVVYWQMALLMGDDCAQRDPGSPRVKGAVAYFIAIYNTIGPSLHCNHYPWT